MPGQPGPRPWWRPPRVRFSVRALMFLSGEETPACILRQLSDEVIIKGVIAPHFELSRAR